MKSLLFIFVPYFILLPQTSFGLSCVLQTMNQEVYDRLDLIVQGTVSVRDGPWQSDAASMDRVPFSINVKNAWKGAKVGDSVKVEYVVFGGDGFPFRDGQKTFVLAESKEGTFRLNGCTMAVDYPSKSPEATLNKLKASADKSVGG